MGTLSLIVHGTTEMPAHMENGPRTYNKYYNYQEAFDKYFDNVDKIGDVVADTVTDDEAVAVGPGDHKHEDIDYINEVGSTVLAQVEKELQRIHHRKAFNMALAG